MAHFALLYNDSELSLLSHDLGGIRTAQVVLPAGTVAGGRISNPNQFGELIAQTMQAATPSAIHGTTVLVGLPDEQAFLKTISLPKKVKGEELNHVIEYQWQELLPITRDQVYYTHRALPQISKDGTDQRVFILAYPKDIIDGLIAALAHVGLTPDKLMPISSGLAEAISSHDDSATLVLDSQTGEDVTALITHQKVAQFSTKVHAGVTTPECAKMINNIISFYETNVPGEVSIKNGLILPGAYAQALQQQCASFGLNVTVFDTNKHAELKNATGHLGSFLALEGLLMSHGSLSLVPPILQASHTETRQHMILRATVTYVTTTLVLFIYLSLVFMASLQFNLHNQPNYAATLLSRTTKESTDISAQVKQVNQKIARLTTAISSRTQTTSLGQTVITIANQASGISATKLMLDNSNAKQTSLTLVGTSNDTTALVTLVSQLQAALPKATVNSPTTTGIAPISFTLMITIPGAAA